MSDGNLEAAESKVERRERLQCFLWQQRHHRRHRTRDQTQHEKVKRFIQDITSWSVIRRRCFHLLCIDTQICSSETQTESQSSPPSSAGDDRNVVPAASNTRRSRANYYSISRRYLRTRHTNTASFILSLWLPLRVASACCVSCVSCDLHLCLSSRSAREVFRNPTGFLCFLTWTVCSSFPQCSVVVPPPTVCFSIFEKSTKKQRTKHDALPSVMISGDCGDGGMLLKRGIMTRRERKSLWRTEMTLLIKIKCLSAGWNGADRASRLRGRRFLAPDLLLNLKTFFSAVEVRKEPG